MTETSTSLVDFYRRHGISPVRQDISDLDAHFTRRSALYRHLGILPSFLAGRTVLEFGPGSGFNSLYTAALGPRRYVLVEGNPTGVNDIERLFADQLVLRPRIEVVSSLIEDYQTDERFDFVFCEGLLGLAGVDDPGALLRRVASFVAPGGVLVITCVDAISLVAETLRRLMADLVSAPNEPLESRLAVLAPIFGAHLSRLGGVSRRHDDWVVDNLINPASIGPLFSIPQAIEAIGGEFDVFGSSPSFVVDWRWYKTIVTPRGGVNENALDAYWQSAHNLLDSRHATAPRDAAANRELFERCSVIRSAAREFEQRGGGEPVAVVRRELAAMADHIGGLAPATAEAMREAVSLLGDPSPNPARIRDSEGFGAWFGRGQQYISFSRVSRT